MSFQLSDRWKGWPDWRLPQKPTALMMGSCFSVEVAQRCQAHGWEVLSNPMGTLFQPLSILSWMKGDWVQLSNSTIFHENKWKMLMAGKPGQSVVSEGELLQWGQGCVDQIHQALQQSHLLVITLGTAQVWHWKARQMQVGNCQRLPQDAFDKQWLSIEDIVGPYTDWIQGVSARFPNLKVVLTVSPVRHEKLGVIENARSKAILLESVHQICGQTTARYFPSYEWVQDELRDYRFYEADGCHPNAQAIDYVTERWINSFQYE
jgi:hypothetical protein